MVTIQKKIMNIKTLYKIIKLFRPEYYDTITRILVVGGLALLSKPIWVDILNIFLFKFKLSIVGEYDWLLGLIIIILSLIYNTTHKYLGYKFEKKSEPAYKKVNYKTFSDFGKLCQEILPILKDNEYIFKTTGPNSTSDYTNVLRTDLTMWEKFKKEVIKPNNFAIKKLITENRHIISNKFDNEFNKMLLHIDAFNHHIENPNFDYSEFQFPKEFSKIILLKAFETAKSDKMLLKKIKWISLNINKDYLEEWFVFGSIVYMPEKANDLDLAVLLNNKVNIETIKSNLNKLKFDFKLKYKMDLHLTIFDNKSDFLIFASNNPFKIEK